MKRPTNDIDEKIRIKAPRTFAKAPNILRMTSPIPLPTFSAP